ncbi:hypothetical protein [Pseudomonas fitomaticsae]|uniref:DUF4145 domain-containing protein n=1 Tax=Pseudomonas fitomaticsae TaxID=2837969 RepID=A0ABY3Q803_9PSED|nr:hypothetical protein [Pseudomonas fitomaticsae]UFQ01714.1 hypothetical protein KJY40_08475 [Pseudomonas fitomaticsae]
MQEAENLPLMPKSALVYYLDEKQSPIPYQKVASIRSCLENIVETIFVHIVEPVDKAKWRRGDLNIRIGLLSHFFSADVIDRLHSIRLLGNDGAHQAKHAALTDERIGDGLSALSVLCEWAILTYIKKHGLMSTDWLATVLSTLPPVYRVRILEPLIESNNLDRARVIAHQEVREAYARRMYQGLIPLDSAPPETTEEEDRIMSFLLSIDKLAMAYLKNKQFERSFEFVQEMFDEGWMTEEFARDTWEKLESLQSSFHSLPISESMEQTRTYLEKILPAVKDEEQNLFLTLFSAMVLESPEARAASFSQAPQLGAAPESAK